MYRKLVVFAALVSVLGTISEGSTPIRKCTEELSAPHFVQINDCEASPCTVFAGSTSNITIHFYAVSNKTEKIHAEIIAFVNDEAFPFEMPNDNADVCKHLGNDAHCPLNAGDEVNYSFMLPLDKSLSNIFVEVEIAMVDEENNSCISCLVADILVKGQMHHHHDQKE